MMRRFSLVKSKNVKLLAPLEGSSVVSSSLFQSSKSSIFSSKFRKKHQSENFEKMNYFQDT